MTYLIRGEDQTGEERRWTVEEPFIAGDYLVNLRRQGWSWAVVVDEAGNPVGSLTGSVVTQVMSLWDLDDEFERAWQEWCDA